jgi:antagonist of KipI
MSLKITRTGLLDTIQDLGRFGYQHLGINTGGAMDRFSAQLCNAILGKDLFAPVIEFHFPASEITFQSDTIICITGADFTPTINGAIIPLFQPVAVRRGACLKFKRRKAGARCYLTIIQSFDLSPWLESYSTNLKAVAGGLHGRRLEKGDELHFPHLKSIRKLLSTSSHHILSWSAPDMRLHGKEVEFIVGHEWNWLSTKTQTQFLNEEFIISLSSDRMGYRLSGNPIISDTLDQLVSTAVSAGTIQLLPDGQLIVLMADHQTTGGYPRIGHVTTSHLSHLAQMQPYDAMRFSMTDLSSAERNLAEQQNYLLYLQKTCKLKMQNTLNGSM